MFNNSIILVALRHNLTGKQKVAFEAYISAITEHKWGHQPRKKTQLGVSIVDLFSHMLFEKKENKLETKRHYGPDPKKSSHSSNAAASAATPTTAPTSKKDSKKTDRELQTKRKTNNYDLVYIVPKNSGSSSEIAERRTEADRTNGRRPPKIAHEPSHPIGAQQIRKTF